MSIPKTVRKSLEKAERKLMSQHATLGFDGTLRVDLNRVFVVRKDGRRALEDLRKLKLAFGK